MITKGRACRHTRSGFTIHCDLAPGRGIPTSNQEELSEEGFGFFRDTWNLGRVGVRLARSVMNQRAQPRVLWRTDSHLIQTSLIP